MAQSLPTASDDELAAALLVLEQEGPAALTLAHVARRLGRSQHGGAESLPWPSERWLRSDLAALGFRRLRAAIAESVAGLDPACADPVDHVLAAGRAYVRVAVRSPALYALMYQPEQADFSHADLKRDSAAAMDQLRASVARLQSTGFEANRDVGELAHIIWDSAHRVAARWADAALDGPVEAETVDEAFDLEFMLLLGESPRRGGESPRRGGESPRKGAEPPKPVTTQARKETRPS